MTLGHHGGGGRSRQFDLAVRPAKTASGRTAAAESFFAATGASVQHGGNQAFYTMAQDRVQMPPFESFRDAESFYATLAHEATHWTRHVFPCSIVCPTGEVASTTDWKETVSASGEATLQCKLH